MAKNDPSKQFDKPIQEFSETVVQINRVSKKTKGGNQMRFSALVVAGDRNGKVGVALAKAKDVRSAVQKAFNYAKDDMFEVPLMGTTVPFELEHKYKASRIILKPAPTGSGIIAGGPMRVVLEAAGVRDAVGKILGTNNKITNVYGTADALKRLSQIKARKEAKKDNK